MGLSDDIDDVDPRSEEQVAAEETVAEVESAVQANDVEGALAAVGVLLEDLWRLDDTAFDEVENPPLAKASAHIPTEYGTVGVDGSEDVDAGCLELMTVCGEVSVWVNIPEDGELAGEGSTGFYLDPKTALWLADALPTFAARAEADEHWEFLAP